MAKKTPKIDRELKAFADKPAATLSGIKSGNVHKFSYGGTNYKIVRAGLLPKTVDYLKATLNTEPVSGQAGGSRTVKFNPGQIINLLKGFSNEQAIMIGSAHGNFAIVHESTELIDPSVNVATDFDACAKKPESGVNGTTLNGAAAPDIITVTPKIEVPADPAENIAKIPTTPQQEIIDVQPAIIAAATTTKPSSDAPLGLEEYRQQRQDDVTNPDDESARTNIETLGFKIRDIKPITGTDINPTEDDTTPTVNNAENDTPATSEEAAEDNIANDAETATETIEVADTTATAFNTYKLSDFSKNGIPEEKNQTAYDFVTHEKGIAAVAYSGRREPIGFMLPRGLLKDDSIETNGRWRISQFMSSIKTKWAKDPLSPDVVTISNQNKAPMTFITMGAALKLRKKGLFKNAPKWVNDHLNTAKDATVEEAKKRAGLEGIDTTTPKPAPTKKPEKTAADTPKVVITPAPAAPTSAPEAEPIVETTTPLIAEEDVTYSAENAMTAVSAAIKKARETQTLVKVNIANQNADDIVHVGTSEEPIAAMENVIEFMKNMGAETPKVEVIDYTSDMVSTITAMKRAWKIASDSDSLVILRPAEGQRQVMTRNADLLKAYQMNF